MKAIHRSQKNAGKHGTHPTIGIMAPMITGGTTIIRMIAGGGIILHLGEPGTHHGRIRSTSAAEAPCRPTDSARSSRVPCTVTHVLRDRAFVLIAPSNVRSN